MLRTGLAVLTAFAILYVLIVAALWLYAQRHPDVVTARDALRLLPDVLRLVRRLSSDKTMPRSVRARLWLLLGYLASPIDLIPDFIPVLGYADDAVVVALVLRSVARGAGPEALARQWPGTPEGLALLSRLAGVTVRNPTGVSGVWQAGRRA